jgi:hypothetical protein
MLRRTFSLLAASALALTATAPVHAQEGETTYVVATSYDVAPADAAAFEDVVMKVKQAAEEANLGYDFRWAVHQNGSAYEFVGWRTSMASFDDPNRFIDAIGGTAGEATLQEAFAMFAQLDIPTDMEVFVQVPEWTYWPGEGGVVPGEHAGLMIFRDWVKFASNQAFDENSRQLIGMLQEVGFPYPVIGQRSVIGEGGVAAFVLLHDGLDQFYGEKDLGKYLVDAGVGEKWGELIAARGAMMRKSMNYPTIFRPDLSYLPANPDM